MSEEGGKFFVEWVSSPPQDEIHIFPLLALSLVFYLEKVPTNTHQNFPKRESG